MTFITNPLNPQKPYLFSCYACVCLQESEVVSAKRSVLLHTSLSVLPLTFHLHVVKSRNYVWRIKDAIFLRLILVCLKMRDVFF